MQRTNENPDDRVADPSQIIADLQRELAQSRSERDEALTQQSATAEVLQVINASPGDLAPVFNAMLGKATQLCEAAFGVLWLCNGEQLHAAALHGAPTAYAAVARTPIEPRPNNPLGRMLRGERLIVSTDVADEEPYREGDPARRALVDLGRARSAIQVALVRDDKLLGSLTVYRQEVRPFTDQQIALLQNFAAQAVIAMENARLITETREALEQQTATAEVLGVINSSPGDLAPVFDAILEKAHGLCGAAFGALWTYDGEHFDAVALRRVPTGLAEFLSRRPFPTAPGSAHDRLLRGERVVHIDDVAAPPLIGPARRALVEDGGARTLVAVPLRNDDRLLGAITAYRQEVRPFTDKQIALLENFAAQAVIAMENARLITETREALEQQTATSEVLAVINSSPGELEPVFDTMLEKAIRLCEAAHGYFLTYDGEAFHPTAIRGKPGFEEFWRQGGPRQGRPVRPSHPSNPLAQLARGARVVHVADAREEEAYREVPEYRSVIDLGGIRTSLTIPLRKEGTLLGAVRVYRQEVRPFTDKQIALLQNFAAQAVIAMENARLITETREALEQQTATAEVLGVINSSPGDLAPVFDAMLERAMRLCEAGFGSLMSYDGDVFSLVALRNLPSDNFRLGAQRRAQEGSLLHRLIEGENIIEIEDIVASAQPSSFGARAALTEAGAHSMLWVALRREGKLVGAFNIYRTEVRSFTDKQIALLQNFAAQAVIAMENARLITETRDALEQQTATAEVLAVINASPGNLAPVFDAMLEKAHKLCGITFGSLQLYENGKVRAVAVRAISEDLAELLRQPMKPRPGSSLSRLLAGERFVQNIDILELAERFPDDPRMKLSAARGLRTGLFVPLRKESEFLGYISAFRDQVRSFSEKEIALLENFAAQAVIALENARLITETREALEQQTATAEVLQVINSSPGDLAPVFDAILEKAMHLCGAAFGELRARDGDSFRSAATRGVPDAFAEYRRNNAFVAEPGSLGARILAGEQVVHVLDLKDEDVYRAGYRNRRALVDLGGARTALVASLRKDGTVLGFIIVYRQEVRAFTDKQIAVLQNFADQAVIAMENARLLGELRQRTEEVAELNRGLEMRVAEQVEELGRVGRLKRFLAPQLAELIVSQGDEKILESHRREIVVVFCDLRGYTAFTETAEPEEVLDFLREYHGALGPLVAQFEGTLDQFSGDGIMVFFNDPLPCPNPAERAVKMAMAMREGAGALIADWRARGRDLGFGAGVAQGYATLGQIGFSERSGYTAIGTVCNVAARLCSEARDGQILLSQRVNVALKGSVATEQIGAVSLKGLTQPVVAYNVPLAATQPALRVIEGGPQSV